MAVDTPHRFRNLVIYEVFIRNYGSSGNLADVTKDLPRIREMGVDVVWFMPIHPIGQEKRKGELGSPYAISDYRLVHPGYGTNKEFELLCQYAHALGLKVMIDVVYNHTSPDSLLAAQHPDWFYRDENGRFANTEPTWEDIIDLDYSQPDLWDYQIETLKQWVRLGVDGFRCDVATAVPLAFWQRARRELAKLKPDIIWLAETTHTDFIRKRRRQGLVAHADAEMHAAFDLSYDYDIWPAWEKAVADGTAVPHYLALLQHQQATLPAHALKMRCVENHDQPRIMGRAPSRAQALAWTAFQAFNEGAFLIYAGQESASPHQPTLFDLDPIKWGDYGLQSFLTTLCRMKKDEVLVEGQFGLLTAVPAITAHWQTENEGLYGVFNVSGVEDVMPTPLPNGEYTDLLGGGPVLVRDGEMMVPETAVILRYPDQLNISPQSFPLT
ncbi:MAG: alpha-amylase [Ardenticatenaceae bacterium]|nr:alpha-amylase [Ardenticatenaceae bacterium]MCB9443509.1 alpha-amylase [Ardenticatenaceae bacterium]